MKGSFLRKGLIGVLVATLAVSGGYAIKTALDFQEEVAIYEMAQSTFITVVEEEVPLAQLPQEVTLEIPAQEQMVETAEPEQSLPKADISVDFEALQQINPEIVAWMHIPGETISYPVVQGDTNSKYLTTTYDLGYSAGGSIFVDCHASGDFSDRNTIIYGHNVNSGTMFATLLAYEDSTYAQNHPYIFLLTPEGELAYEVCYALVTTATDDAYTKDFTEEQAFATHLDNLASQALYNTGVEVTTQDNIITLSTCTNVTQEGRFVVVAKALTP